MKFFKQNSYDVIRLFINQIGISIFSLFIYTAFGAFWFKDQTSRSTEEIWMLIGVSVLSMVFYYFLLYTATWDYGAKDKIRIDGGKLEKDSLKGLKLGLFAIVPSVVLALLAAALRGVYMISGVDGFGVAASIFHVIIQLITSMYDGLLQAVFNGIRVSQGPSSNLYFLLIEIGYAALSFLSLAVMNLGYVRGLKDKKIVKTKNTKGYR